MNPIIASGWGYLSGSGDPIGKQVEGEWITPSDSLDPYKIKTKDGLIYRVGDYRVVQLRLVKFQKLDGSWTRDYDEVFLERIANAK